MNLINELDNLTPVQLKELAHKSLTRQEEYYILVASKKTDSHSAFWMMHGGFIGIKERFRLPQTIFPQP